MPRPSARPSRHRLARALSLACAGALLAACSGGGGGSSGGTASTAASSPTSTGGTSSITLAWGSASGPVAGYSVYVQRGDADFKHEADVSQARVTLSGEPGSTARMIVVAFDAQNTYGPSSPISPPFTFPAGGASSGGSGAGAASSSPAASATTAAGSTGGSTASALAPATKDPATSPPSGGALLWQAGDGFRVTDGALATLRSFVLPAPGAVLAGVADFDADGQDDLLWVGADGQLGYTPGSALRNTDAISVVAMGALAAGERVLGAGDLDGDGDGDVLVANGDAVRGRLTAASGVPAWVDLGSAGQATFAGIADFDANGSADVAWRSNTGSLVIWLIDRAQPIASVEVPLAPDLTVLGIGDFDADGAAEVALRGPDGSAFVLHPLAAQPTLEVTDLVNTVGWQGLGAVDLDADGSDELVLAEAGAIRIAGLPGDELIPLDPNSPWQPVALIR